MKKMSIENLIKEFNGDVVKIDKRLRVLSSNKCNLKKKKDFIDSKVYEKELDKILKEVELLKECKEVINGKKVVNYMDLSEEEIKELSYDSIEKGLRSLSSIKSRNSFNMSLVEEIEKKYEIFKKYKEEKKDNIIGKVDFKVIYEVIKMVEERKDSEVNKDFMLKVLNSLVK